MMTMMKYMASARAGFLGQGAARIIRSSNHYENSTPNGYGVGSDGIGSGGRHECISSGQRFAYGTWPYIRICSDWERMLTTPPVGDPYQPL